ncbi:MAG: helix-turn-helix domain-containing protein [Victivallaceae bacterium]|nr:helix-turn-helix domain-containing protein [Victivallaceae bacterium]
MDQDEVIGRLRGGVHRIYPEKASHREENTATFVSSSHAFREILFVLNGTSEYMLNNQVFPATPGDIFLIDRWMPHAFGYRTCDNNLLHLWGYFDAEQMHAAVFQVGCSGQYTCRFKQIRLERDITTYFQRKWTQCALTFRCEELRPVLNALLDEIAYELENFKIPAPALREDFIVNTANYIRVMNGRDCSLAHLSKISGYSQSYLARRFQSQTGKSIRQYINEIRLNYFLAAQEYGLKQKEIAFELGFASPAAFWLWLRNHLNNAAQNSPDISA